MNQVVMDEGVVIVMICGLWAMAAYILYLKLFVIRRQRRRIDKFADQALIAARDAVRAEAPAADSGDMKRIQQRLAVLERIAVDKEDVLSRQIEELRVVGR